MDQTEANLQVDEVTQQIMKDPLYDPPGTTHLLPSNEALEAQKTIRGSPNKIRSNLLKKCAYQNDQVEEIMPNMEHENSHSSPQELMEDDLPIESLPVIKHSDRTCLSVFSDHPNQFNQTYLEHMYDSLKYSTISMYCSIVFFIHAVFPFLFQFTGSDWIIHLGKMFMKKRKLS
jgi:hypothetical protein